MHPDPVARGLHPVFSWKAERASFAIYDAEPIAEGLPAREQIRIAQEALSVAPSGALLAGALPFDISEPGALWLGVPVEMRFPTEDLPGTPASNLEESTIEADREFIRFSREALEHVDSGKLTKVVASRRFSVTNSSVFRPLEIFARLSQDTAAAAFLCQSGSQTLVGASPETLVRKDGAEVLSMPLAGSRSREVGDRAQASAILLHSEKDLREHKLVVDQILEALRSAGVHSVDQTEPFVLGTKRIWHLATSIRGELDAEASSDSLDLVKLLHPTPAVCGTPSDLALDYIRQHESESRGLYSGAIGWQTKDGNGEWRVTLRCGLITGNTAEVMSGAGLVAGSDVHEELLETKHKAMTLIDAL